MKTRLRIIRDIDPGSPRGMEPVGTMVLWHRDIATSDGDVSVRRDDYESAEDVLKATLPCERGETVVLPIYVYEHGGRVFQTTPFTCTWDSGQVGWIFADPERVCERWEGHEKPTDDALREILKAEVQEYDAWQSGNVWGFVEEEIVECGDCGHVRYETLESCWGFIGDDAPQMIRGCLTGDTVGMVDEAWEKRFEHDG